jgi:hypothetical protein
MDDATLRYTSDDHVYRNVDDLSRHARLSRAFIRLCIDAGCPRHETRLTHAMLLDWLSANYVEVRALAGLRQVASIDGLPARSQRDLRRANMMLTILEFSESRSSNPSEKAQLRKMQHLVERSV